MEPGHRNPMTRLLAQRLQALLLATTLVVGGIGLPLGDAILFHGPRPVDRGPVRVEQADAGAAHILQCALTQAATRTRSLRPSGTPRILGSIPAATAIEPRAAEAPEAPPATLQLARAPPARPA